MAGHVHIVGDQNDGVALSVQLLEDRHHLLAALAIQCAGRFIGEDHFAAIGQRPGDTDPLLLTAGELARGMVAAIGQPQSAQQLTRARLAIRAAGAGIDCRDLHVGGGIEMGQQVVALKDKTEVVAAQPGQRQRIHGGGVLTAKQILTAARAIETTQQVHQGRFAGAGCADNGDHLSCRDGEIKRVEHGDFAVAALVASLDPFQLDQRQLVQGLTHSMTATSS